MHPATTAEPTTVEPTTDVPTTAKSTTIEPTTAKPTEPETSKDDGDSNSNGGGRCYFNGFSIEVPEDYTYEVDGDKVTFYESYNQLTYIVDNLYNHLTPDDQCKVHCYQAAIVYNYSVGCYTDFIYRVHGYSELVRQLIIKTYGRLL